MSDFLLELRSEEIPARMQAGARAEMDKLFRRAMEAAGVAHGETTIWSTPRRLALIARELPNETKAVSEEIKGPPEGAPDKAIDGFCRKNNVSRDQLAVREVKGRPTYFTVIDTPGRAVKDVLATAIPAIIRDFSWPKSMRWGGASLISESLRWVRPLSGIVALFDGQIVECEVHGVTSGAVTLGHRFHHAGDITIGGADDYAIKLRAAQVIVDQAEREELIREGARKAAADAGLDLVEDEGLVVENAGLTEWPVPLLGRFEDGFLEVPPEIIQLTARVNQKYFVCTFPLPQAGGVGAGSDDGETPTPKPSRKREGELANAFICTANIEAADGGATIVHGNRKVLAARLSDARFFWDVDRKKTLAHHAEGLERITFHEKLGTVADKVERVAKLARWLVEEGIVKETPLPLAGRVGGGPDDLDTPTPSRFASATPAAPRKREGDLADHAELAARLCKADLVTEMVGEFPELQGVMGGYYARAEGLDDAVADAIRDHYKPAGQGDEVPTAPVTVAVSLADKLDTVLSFFAAKEKPTGSKDPFALRRAALGILSISQTNNLRFSIMPVLVQHLLQRHGFQHDQSSGYGFGELSTGTFLEFIECSSGAGFGAGSDNIHLVSELANDVAEYVLNFFADRLKVQQREAGVRHDLIDAVFALGGEDDLVRLLARVHALQSFIETEDGTNLLAGYKRASNILKKENDAFADREPPQTGEEDPLALVDDPILKDIVAEQATGGSTLSYTPEPSETALIDALDTAEPEATAAIEREDFETAMSALASLRAPIDRFFDDVTVNDEDPTKRAARLSLLTRFRDAVHQVADFSRIEG